MQWLLREPLLHFLILGGLIFSVYFAFYEPAVLATNVITIGPERIEQLSKSFAAVWQHPPSSKELEGILENEIREEVYYREAIALGLDTNDAIVRRRLRQKMEFLADSSAGLLEPAAGELEAYLVTHKAKFQSTPRVSFRQIFLGTDPSTESIERLLRDLRAGAPGDEPRSPGTRSLLPTEMDLSSPRTIDAVFGEGFYAKLAMLPNERWTGPVESTYGAHVVRLGEFVARRTPPLAEIRETLLLDWKATKAREIRELHYATLRERYAVEIRPPDTGPAESR